MMTHSTIDTEENHVHLNIPVIAKHIEKYDDFAIVHRIYTDEQRSSSEKLNRLYYIVPVKEIGDSGMQTEGMCYDNCDINGNVIMSREEMLIRFSLIFGKTVEYEIEMESEWFDSNDKIVYIGKIRNNVEQHV